MTETRASAMPILAGNGAYRRGYDGTWRYACSGLAVPGAQDVYDGFGRVVSMIAPELAPDLLMSEQDIADAYGVSVKYVSAEHSHGRLPRAPVRVGHCPGWTVPIVEWWWTHRPGQGAGGGNRRKLDDGQVTAARARYAAGGVTHAELAAGLGVARSTLTNALRRAAATPGSASPRPTAPAAP